MTGLSGKTAIITGAAGGIGQAIATRLSRDGANIVINDICDPSIANGVVSDIEANGGRAIAVLADITNADDVNRLMDDAMEAFGSIDVLVNNAGRRHFGPIEEMSEADWDTIYALNAKAPFLVTQAALRRMPGKPGDEPGDGGAIVMVSSSTTQFPIANGTLYMSSKTVPRALTDVLAKEVGPRGIRINAVLPGPTSPGMFDEAPPELQERAVAMSPFNRVGRADEVAAVVSFLVSDDARWVTGQHILVNGGASI